MELIEFAKERGRLCKYYTNVASRSCVSCTLCCPLSAGSDNNGTVFDCWRFFMECPEKAEKIVILFAKEHPPKTRADDFYEKHPKARKDCTGVPTVCCADCGYCTEEECEALGEEGEPCTRCWNMSVEDV